MSYFLPLTPYRRSPVMGEVRNPPESRNAGHPYFFCAVIARSRSAIVLSREMAKAGLDLTRFRKSLRLMVNNRLSRSATAVAERVA